MRVFFLHDRQITSLLKQHTISLSVIYLCAAVLGLLIASSIKNSFHTAIFEIIISRDHFCAYNDRILSGFFF